MTTLRDSIRYQVNTPAVTTMGTCITGCGSHARGGGTCAECLIDQLPKGEREYAWAWVKAQRLANLALWAWEEEA